MMEMIGFMACFLVGIVVMATFTWVCVTTHSNENSIDRLWDENRKLKDRIFDLENKLAHKTK